MHITAMLRDDEKYLCNFSSFHRPPKFVKRDSGKLIILIITSILIAFSYPVIYWIITYSQELQHTILQDDYSQIHKTKILRETDIKNKEADKTKALAL